MILWVSLTLDLNTTLRLSTSRPMFLVCCIILQLVGVAVADIHAQAYHQLGKMYGLPNKKQTTCSLCIRSAQLLLTIMWSVINTD
jgi:hypothetical protein